MSQYSSIRECLFSQTDDCASLDECLHIEMFRNLQRHMRNYAA